VVYGSLPAALRRLLTLVVARRLVLDEEPILELEAA
jgi:hypothetical protein